MASTGNKSANQNEVKKPAAPEASKPTAQNSDSQSANAPMDEDAERKDGAVEGGGKVDDGEATSPIFDNAADTTVNPAPQETALGKSANQNEALTPTDNVQDQDSLSPAAVLPEAPAAVIPEPVEPVVNNGMMSLLDRHNQPTVLPEKTAKFLLQRYPNRYKINGQ